MVGLLSFSALEQATNKFFIQFWNRGGIVLELRGIVLEMGGIEDEDPTLSSQESEMSIMSQDTY